LVLFLSEGVGKKMAFYLPLPEVCVKLEEHFIINEVRTKSSLGHKNTLQEIKDKYEQKIKVNKKLRTDQIIFLLMREKDILSVQE
jgi:hypothetical protein